MILEGELAITAKTLPPKDISIAKQSKQGEILETRANGYVAPTSDVTTECQSSQAKFLIIIETAALSEIELQII